MTAQSVLTPTQVRHRVVGVILFLSVCVLVLPWVLDSDSAAYDPRKPAIEEVPLSPFAGPPTAPAEMPVEAVRMLNQGQQILNPDADPVAVMPDAWGVRAGSFRSQENAMKLADQLRSKQWAGVRVIERGGLHRVIIGPLRARQDAEQLLGALDNDFNLKGAVTRFRP